MALTEATQPTRLCMDVNNVCPPPPPWAHPSCSVKRYILCTVMLLPCPPITDALCWAHAVARTHLCAATHQCGGRAAARQQPQGGCTWLLLRSCFCCATIELCFVAGFCVVGRWGALILVVVTDTLWRQGCQQLVAMCAEQSNEFLICQPPYMLQAAETES